MGEYKLKDRILINMTWADIVILGRKKILLLIKKAYHFLFQDPNRSVPDARVDIEIQSGLTFIPVEQAE